MRISGRASQLATIRSIRAGPPERKLRIRNVGEPPPVAPVPQPAKPAAAAGLEIAPEWRVKPEPPRFGDAAALGRRHAVGAEPRPSCRMPLSSGLRPTDCPPDAGEIAASTFDKARDDKLGGFEAEGRRKESMKTYHELPGGAGYPGFGCAIFHRHC